jgi:signal transduction histidine kinase
MSISDPPAEVTDAAAALLPEHLQLLRTHLPVVFFTLDHDLRFIAASGRALVQWGEEEAVIGRSAAEVFGEEPDALTRLTTAAESGAESHWNGEFRGYTWEFRCAPTREGDLSGIAVNITDRRHAEGELRWRTREMAALNAITSEVGSTLEFSELLTTLRKQLADHLHILAGAVFLLDFATFEPALHSAWGVSPALLDRTTAFVATHLAVDAPALATLSGDLFHGLREGDPWQSAFCVPLLASDQMLGTLVLFGPEPLTFSRHRPSFFEMLGRQVGASLQNARVFREAQQGREQLQQLTRRIVTAQEAERQRVARELHDELGQILTCLKLSLDLAERQGIAPTVVAHHREQARQLTNELIGKVRQMSLELRSAVLDELGLLHALRSHAERFSSQTNIKVEVFESGLGGERFEPDVETAAYRIVQEALTNVARHAAGAEVRVTLERDEGSLRVRVQDNGQGFDTRRSRNLSSGLAGMRERAVAAGGTLVVQSAPGRGTLVEAWLPLAAEADPGQGVTGAEEEIGVPEN